MTTRSGKIYQEKSLSEKSLSEKISLSDEEIKEKASEFVTIIKNVVSKFDKIDKKIENNTVDITTAKMNKIVLVSEVFSGINQYYHDLANHAPFSGKKHFLEAIQQKIDEIRIVLQEEEIKNKQNAKLVHAISEMNTAEQVIANYLP